MMTKFNNTDHNIVDDIKYSGTLKLMIDLSQKIKGKSPLTQNTVTVGAENNYLNS